MELVTIGDYLVRVGAVAGPGQIGTRSTGSRTQSRNVAAGAVVGRWVVRLVVIGIAQ